MYQFTCCNIYIYFFLPEDEYAARSKVLLVARRYDGPAKSIIWVINNGMKLNGYHMQMNFYV